MRENLPVEPVKPQSYDSYYGQQIIKTPTWKTPDVPIYLFVGGMAGASAVLAEGAALSGNTRLEHFGRLVAAGGATVGTVALIHDLGRPERFLYMLRVFKPTSPLSMGSYILSPFAAGASAAAASQVTGIFPGLGRLAGAVSTLFGPPLVTYTAALFANTVVPAWSEARAELPFLFAGSGCGAAGGLAMVCLPVEVTGPARRMAIAGAVLDLVAEERMEHKLSFLAEPYQQGKSGRLMKAAKIGTATGLALSVLGRRSRTLRVLGGAALVGASLTTRFGVFEAGLASARDPKYTVIPQRERLAQREATRQAEADGRAPASATA